MFIESGTRDKEWKKYIGFNKYKSQLIMYTKIEKQEDYLILKYALENTFKI